MCSPGSGQEDTAAHLAYNGRGGKASGPCHGTGNSIWQVWISQDHSNAQGGRLVVESQKSGEDLEKRRPKGTEEAAEEGEAMG